MSLVCTDNYRPELTASPFVANPGTRLRAATVSQCGSFVTASPNAEYVPQVVQGIVEIQLHANGRYGYADPLQWPQIYTPKYAFLVAIPKRRCSPHPDSPIWTLPDVADFLPCGGCPIRGFGQLAPQATERLRRCVDQMEERIEAFVAQPPAGVPSLTHLRWFGYGMRAAARRLLQMPSSFRDAVLQFTEAQRHWLLAWAFMEWYGIITLQAPDACQPSRTDLMGAWTSDLAVVDFLSALGVPVWFVHKGSALLVPDGSEVLPSMCVLKDISTPQLLLDDARPLYKGLVGEAHLDVALRPGNHYVDMSRCPTSNFFSPSHYPPPVSQLESKAATARDQLLSMDGSRTTPTKRDAAPNTTLQGVYGPGLIATRPTRTQLPT